MADSFADTRKGDRLLIYRDDRLKDVASVIHETPTQLRVKSRRILATTFSRRTGNGIGSAKVFSLRLATDAEIAAAEKELEAQRLEKEESEQRARQAAYDALPESVKLARSLMFYCDINTEKKLSEMPLGTLRAAVQWIEEHGKTE